MHNPSHLVNGTGKLTTHSLPQSKVYYRSQSRSQSCASPKSVALSAHTHDRVLAPSKMKKSTEWETNRAGSHMMGTAALDPSVGAHLGELAARLHKSQERENEALGNLVQGLHQFTISSPHPKVVGPSNWQNGNSSMTTNNSDASYLHHQQGISESPTVDRPASTISSPTSSRRNRPQSDTPMSSPPSSSRMYKSTGRVIVGGRAGEKDDVGVVVNTSSIKQHSTSSSSDTTSTTLTLVSQSPKSAVATPQQQTRLVIEGLLDENDALRQQVEKYRERSETQQDHLSRLLACISKYEATTAHGSGGRHGGGTRGTARAQSSFDYDNHNGQTSSSFISSPPPSVDPTTRSAPRYTTHTTSSLYHRAPLNLTDGISSGMTSSNHHHRSPPVTPQKDDYPSHSRRRHLRPQQHAPLLSESTLELLLMAERRVADGSSFLSP